MLQLLVVTEGPAAVLDGPWVDVLDELELRLGQYQLVLAVRVRVHHEDLLELSIAIFCHILQYFIKIHAILLLLTVYYLHRFYWLLLVRIRLRLDYRLRVLNRVRVIRFAGAHIGHPMVAGARHLLITKVVISAVFIVLMRRLNPHPRHLIAFIIRRLWMVHAQLAEIVLKVALVLARAREVSIEDRP